MKELISQKSKETYAQLLDVREEIFDFSNPDPEMYAELTKQNSKVIEESAAPYMDGVNISYKETDGIPFEYILIEGAEKNKFIYYIHGGGFVWGEAAWGHFCAVQIAKKSKKNIVAVNYRLAPEYKFPAAPNDCLTVYKWMLDQDIRPQDISFVGESAGGNLVLTTAVACKMQNLPMPESIVAISPCVDIHFTFPAFRERADRDCILPKNQDRFTQVVYMEDKDLYNPLASPYYGDCKGFPPVLIGVSTEEMLFDDSVRMHEKLLKDGVDSHLIVWEQMWHTFYMTDLPESWKVFDQICEFWENL